MTVREVTTLSEVMERRGRESRGFLDLEAGMNAIVSDMAPWHHDDLRASEAAALDELIGEAAERAQDAALKAAAEYLSEALDEPGRAIPPAVIEHQASDALRADLGLVETRPTYPVNEVLAELNERAQRELGE